VPIHVQQTHLFGTCGVGHSADRPTSSRTTRGVLAPAGRQAVPLASHSQVGQVRSSVPSCTEPLRCICRRMGERSPVSVYAAGDVRLVPPLDGCVSFRERTGDGGAGYFWE